MNATYTIADLDAQLSHARDMMRKSGLPGVRLTRTCDEDSTLARQIEAQDPFQYLTGPRPHMAYILRGEEFFTMLESFDQGPAPWQVGVEF